MIALATTLLGWGAALLRIGKQHWRWLVPTFGLVALGVALLFARADSRHWRNLADKRADTIKANAAAYAQAQRDAQIRAEGERRGWEARLTDQAKRTDDAEDHAQAAARGAVTAYAAAHRVRPACVDRAPGGAPAAAVPGPAARGDGAGAAADMVAVSRADFNALTAAAVRAAIVHQWGESLIAQGYALPADPPQAAAGLAPQPDQK